MASTVFARGAHTMSSVVFKPVGRKANYHKNSGDMIRESCMRSEGEEVKRPLGHDHQNGNLNLWVPHERTGIYYPKGHEKVMDDVPSKAAKDVITVNWFSYNDNIN